MRFFIRLFFICLLCWMPATLQADSFLPQVSLSFGGEGGGQVASAMKIFLFMTILSIGPALLLTMTCFTRIIIVLSFLRQAIGVQQSPPNQVMVGLALFLTVFLMSPIFKQVYTEALSPFMSDQIDQETAFNRASTPIKKFMLSQTRKTEIELLLNLSKSEKPKDIDSLSMMVLIPAFVLSELKTAFLIGFLIYLPFVLIDMVVAMILLTMGMMVVPPMILSLPFKLMLFVLVDGWSLVIGSLMKSFK